MNEGDFGIECENCECLTCTKNDDKCKNCAKCNGNINYSNWMMDCKKYNECNRPEENTKIILNGITS